MTPADKALQDFLRHPENGPILELAGESDEAVKEYLFPRLLSPLHVVYIDTAHLLTPKDASLIATPNVVYTTASEHSELLNILGEAEEADTVIIDNWYNIKNRPVKLAHFLTECRRKAIRNTFSLIFINQMMMNPDYPDKSNFKNKPVFDRVFNKKCSLRLFIRQDNFVPFKSIIRLNRARYGL